MSILRFTANYKTDGVTFNTSQEWEVLDEYKGMINDPCDDCPPRWTTYYRFVYPKDEIVYTVPAEVVVIIDKHTSNNRTLTTQEQKWKEKVTRDQITTIYDKEDYVRAGKEFMGIDIGAKKREDKADYAYYYPTSPALKRSSYEDSESE